MKEIIVDGVTYVPKQTEGEKLIIGIVDNRGLTYVGYSTLKKNEYGMYDIRAAQCIIRWWTGAHLNYLVDGVCDGVELGASADIMVNEFIQVIVLPFEGLEDWKASKKVKGSKEVI